MPERVALLSLNTEINVDTFEIQDLNAAGEIVARVDIRGGDRYVFNCAPDGQGFGNLNIRNINLQFINYDFVRDDDVLRI